MFQVREFLEKVITEKNAFEVQIVHIYITVTAFTNLRNFI